MSVDGSLYAAARPPFSARVRFRLAAGSAACLLAAAACGSADAPDAADGPDAAEETADVGAEPVGTVAPDADPADAGGRAVVVITTGCGSANGGEGSGVALSPTMVLTAAHVVAGSTDIAVRLRGDVPIETTIGAITTQAESEGGEFEAGAAGDGEAEVGVEVGVEATVVAYDTRRDLALLDLGDDGLTPVPDPPLVGHAAAGGKGVIAGAGVSGDVAFTVEERTTIVIDEVRGVDRVRRSGYILDAATVRGDSGSGLYDEDGRLVGVLFAVSSDDGDRSWATAGTEVEDFLVDDEVRGSFACDPDASQLAPTGP